MILPSKPPFFFASCCVAKVEGPLGSVGDKGACGVDGPKDEGVRRASGSGDGEGTYLREGAGVGG